MKTVKQMLQNHILFSQSSDAQIDEVISKSRIISKRNGETLFSPHDECRSMTLIIEGKLRIEKILPNGKVLIIDTMEEGMVISEACAFLNKPYPAWVVASGEVKVLNIPITAIKGMTGDNLFSLGLMSLLSMKLYKFQEKLELLSVNSAEQRVALYIMRLAGADYHKSFSLPGSKTSIAKQLGFTRETVSRIFSTFVEEGILSEEDRGVYRIIDPEGFSEILDEV